MKRRKFLKGAGVVSILVAGGGVWRAYDQGVFSTGEGPAYEPWKNWRTDKSKDPLNLVRAAILAANAHDTQPWLFRVTETQIDIFADRSRNLGAIDSYLREMHISLGCALENLLLAAEANGYAYELKLMPDDTDITHVARIKLAAGKIIHSELYEAIPNRHTNRGDKTGPVPQEVLDSLASLNNDGHEVSLFWFVSEEERRKFGGYQVQAVEALIADEEQSRDSFKWGRHRWKDIQRFRDGVTVDAAPIPTAVRVIAKMLPPPSQKMADDIFLSVMKDIHKTQPIFGIIAVRNGRNNAQRIKGGRLWQRMHLWGTTKGIAMSPINQIPERADREDSLGIPPQSGNALKDLIGDPGWQALMPFSLGYPTMKALASPRRAVEDVLI